METEAALTLETKKYPWWLLLMSGILSVLIGILLVTNPGKTAVALAWGLGLYWFIQGTFTLIGMFIDHSAWGWKLLVGILGVLAGIVVMRHPVASAAAIPMILVLLLGIQGVISGCVSLLLAFRGGGWGAGILGALSIIFGIILILNYAAIGTLVFVFWFVTIMAFVVGIVQIIHAFQQRKA